MSSPWKCVEKAMASEGSEFLQAHCRKQLCKAWFSPSEIHSIQSAVWLRTLDGRVWWKLYIDFDHATDVVFWNIIVLVSAMNLRLVVTSKLRSRRCTTELRPHSYSFINCLWQHGLMLQHVCGLHQAILSPYNIEWWCGYASCHLGEKDERVIVDIGCTQVFSALYRQC